MSTTEQLEIERKYDVSAVARVPDLADVGPVTSTQSEEPFDLRAVYLDTAEHLLLANRITLRRREGGHDSGWHVKLPPSPDSESDGGSGSHSPSASGARREVHAPLGARPDEALPADIRRVVEVVLRGRPVHPVLILETTRTVTQLADGDGTRLAEVADDEVTATRPDQAAEPPRAWREWEVELAEGISRADGEALLDAVGDALERAGASVSSSKSKLARGLGDVALAPGLLRAEPVHLPAKSAGAFVIGTLASLIGELHALDPRVRAGEQDAVHDFRITLRRLRSVLHVYGGVIDPDERDRLLDLLAAVGRAAGVARDLHVAGDELERLVASAPEGFVSQQVVGRLRAGFRENARDAGHDLERALSDPAYFELLDRLDVVVTTVPTGAETQAKVADFVAGRLTHERRRARRRLRAGVHELSADAPDLVLLHDARKAARRLRYAVEAARKAHVKGVGGARVAKDAHRIQSALGDALDAAAAVDTYVAAAETARWAEEDTFGYGVLATVALRVRDDSFALVPELAERL